MFGKFQLQIPIYVKCKRSTGWIFLWAFLRQCKQKHTGTAAFRAPLNGAGDAPNLPQASGQPGRLGALRTEPFVNMHIYMYVNTTPVSLDMYLNRLPAAVRIETTHPGVQQVRGFLPA